MFSKSSFGIALKGNSLYSLGSSSFTLTLLLPASASTPICKSIFSLFSILRIILFDKRSPAVVSIWYAWGTRIAAVLTHSHPQEISSHSVSFNEGRGIRRTSPFLLPGGLRLDILALTRIGLPSYSSTFEPSILLTIIIFILSWRREGPYSSITKNGTRTFTK